MSRARNPIPVVVLALDAVVVFGALLAAAALRARLDLFAEPVGVSEGLAHVGP